MSATVVGLSCYLEPARWGAWELPAALLPQWYVDLFQSAGATVVLLPPGNDAAVLDRLDGLALVGGADVDARLYGAEPHETADVARSTRDASELSLYRGARGRRMPVLGICRGLQVMAIAHGGSLIQNLPDVEGSGVHRERPGTFVAHGATFAGGSLAASIFGVDPVTVNSSHHQAVDSPGDLVVSGRAADGTIETCEDPSADFCLGVQWHPEHPDRRVTDLPMVAAFVAAAGRYRTGGRATAG
jgi:putative glutamine amidotransferase